jgi:RNA polymerase sigma-70 factor (ECF subfamily)
VETEAEIEAWVKAVLPRAYAYARSLVKDAHTAEDLVQDCLCRLLAKQYDLPRDGQKLLYRAISNAAINWTTRRKSLVSLNADDAHPAVSSSFGPEALSEGRELEIAVAHALVELPAMQRAAVQLRSLGHSQEEVAEILEISGSHAGVLIHRARKQLAVSLAPFLGEEAVR